MLCHMQRPFRLRESGPGGVVKPTRETAPERGSGQPRILQGPSSKEAGVVWRAPLHTLEL